MRIEASEQRYGEVARVLHWLIAGLIACQFVLARLAERADEASLPVRQLILLANHKSVGITVLALAVLRLAWRLSMPAIVPWPSNGAGF